jgi:hypothetical protein
MIAGGWFSKYWIFAPQSAASRAGSEMQDTKSKPTFRRFELSLDQVVKVSAVITILDPGIVAGKHHRNRHQWQMVDGLILNLGDYSFSWSHMFLKSLSRTEVNQVPVGQGSSLYDT